MTSRARVGANLATLANGVLGIGAILYVLAGNPYWAMLLIVSGIAFDGLDGLLSRRAKSPSGSFGRIADSIADAVTFGLAPASLLIVHTVNSSAWSPYYPWTLIVGVLVAVLAIARLIYFTWRGHQLPYFLGAPTPQTALAIIVILLLGDAPGFWGTLPVFVLIATLVVTLLMVLPIRFPKVRRGSPIRWAMTLTAIALVIAIIPIQFFPRPGSPLYLLAEVATLASGAGVAVYYLWGPLTVRSSVPPREEVAAHV
ncbi:MAG: CDP-alcohol phosphatidyltransferase family protein [Thermoplasmata archaeon]